MANAGVGFCFFTCILFASLSSASAASNENITDNPADQLVAVINSNRTASRSSSLNSNPGLGCLALQYIKAYEGDCKAVGGPDAKKPADSEFSNSFAPHCGVEVSTLTPITGRLLACQSKYVSPSDAFSKILMENERSIEIVHSRSHSEIGAAVSGSGGGGPYFWCVLFSNGTSNSSFVLQGGVERVERPGCFSGASDACSGAAAILARRGFDIMWLAMFAGFVAFSWGVGF